MAEPSPLQAAFAAEFSPKRVEVSEICFDGELVAHLEATQKELAEYSDMLGAPKELKEKVERLQKEAEDKKHSFMFKSIGRKAWSDLISEHPPTDEQKTQNSVLDHNPDTFLPAAAAACCIEIDGKPQEMPPDLAEWLFETLADSDASRMFNACVEANVLGVKVPKKVVTATARRSKKS